MLPDKAYKEFKEIYLEEFGEELTDEDVVKKANDLIDLFSMFRKSSIPVRSTPIDTKERKNLNENS